MWRIAVSALLAVLLSHPVAAQSMAGGGSITIGSTTISLGQTTTTVAGLTLSGATLSGTTNLTGMTTATGNFGVLRLQQDNGTGFRFQLNNDGKLYLQDTINSFTSTVHNILVADSATGNIGISNTNPQTLLHVGTNAATARSYNSFTDASNGTWAYLGDWGKAANVATYGTDFNGTGNARDVQLVAGGTAGLRMHATTQLIALGPAAALTSAFPALKRSATQLQIRLGDDSAYAPLSASDGILSGSLMVGSATALTLTSGAVGMQKIAASASAPGAAGAKLEVVCGTNAGTAKLVIAAGTSATAVTVVDNVGSGVTGC